MNIRQFHQRWRRLRDGGHDQPGRICRRMMLPDAAEIRGKKVGAGRGAGIAGPPAKHRPANAAIYAMQQLPLTPIGAAALPTPRPARGIEGGRNRLDRSRRVC
jgi:hypothetical protein